MIEQKITELIKQLNNKLPDGLSASCWPGNHVAVLDRDRKPVILITYELIDDAAIDFVEYVFSMLRIAP